MTGTPESQNEKLSLLGRRVLLGITGSIAAYKSAFLARELIKRGAYVRVVMTPSAIEFITPLTLATLTGMPVHSDFTENKDSGKWTNHVELGLWGDLFLVAPCTADTLSAFANGTCSNLLQAVFLSARCPVMLAPAMDLDMFTNEATLNNILTLKNRDVKIIEPGSGALASGLEGKGRMEEPEIIADFVDNFFRDGLPLVGKNVVVTAGPTEEPIDAVRYLGNRSTGKMGFEIAARLADLGANVVLIAGPVKIDTPPRVAKRINVMTAQEMYEETMGVWSEMDAGIACAAIADMRPVNPSNKKLHRADLPGKIILENTPDTLLEMGARKTDSQILMGFALETDSVEESLKSAKGKLERKNLDFIVMNTLADDGAGFSNDTNKVTVLKKVDMHTEKRIFELKSKREVAHDLIEMLSTLLIS
ncbi:MAG: bifunctional phosphopantothenoylcysteine decarboxylase/phosphopantothenate--cysteine ligase CoaBC [Bacteroidetes bacterium]|nr:MAG: bifunctional phosphopantothenoylcysteine decarboxylase/phosphopantothenate--cysteine ligase CoaBC [Bacteroidota bacterium]